MRAIIDRHASDFMIDLVSFPLFSCLSFRYAVPKDCCEDQTHR